MKTRDKIIARNAHEIAKYQKILLINLILLRLTHIHSHSYQNKDICYDMIRRINGAGVFVNFLECTPTCKRLKA